MNTNDINAALSRRELTLYAVTTLGLKSKSKIYSSTSQMQFHCPFHVDNTPSMSINLELGIYHCFSCGKGGSIESLYWDMTGKSLKKVLGIPKDSFSNFSRSLNSPDNQKEDFNLKNIYINIDWAEFEDAWQNKNCRNFLQNRGISEKVCRSMKFRYTSISNINTTRFVRRLIIPIYENKRLVAVEGRRVFPEDPDPKVLYCRNGSVNTLFDIDDLNKSEDVFAVEGLMDLAVLRNNDFFKNSTSIFGANLTKRQLHLIKDFKRFVYIPDNDEAGEKTIQQLRDSDLDNIYVLRLPKNLQNQPLKDVGDLPKLGLDVDYLLDRKWTNYIRKLN